MNDPMTRRQWLAASGAGVASLAQDETDASRRIKIVGLACSPRPGKTTAVAVQASLDAAAQVNDRIQTQFIDLGTLQFRGWSPVEQPDPDDFDRHVLPALRDPTLGGLIIGSPVYFRNLTSLCMAAIERMGALRQPHYLLSGVAVGVLCVGGFRHGGQELVLQQIQAAMLCHEAIIVGGKPPAMQGATLLNPGDDDVTRDELGMQTAALLGQRVAEAAIQCRI